MKRDLKKLEIAIIKTMIMAHSSSAGHMLTAEEFLDCKTILSQLQNEILSREIKSELTISLFK